ncbi:MAG: hypothetical protein ACLFVO_19275 [Chloroflexaceae bacterium]
MNKNANADFQRRRGIEILDLTGYASHEPVWLLSDGTYIVGATRLNAIVKAWMIGTVAEVRIVQNVLAREAAVRLQLAAARVVAEGQANSDTGPKKL